MEIPDDVTGRTQFIRVANPDAVDPALHGSQNPLLGNHYFHALLELKHHVPYKPSDLNRIPVEAHVRNATVHVILLHSGPHTPHYFRPHLIISLINEVSKLGSGVNHGLTRPASVGVKNRRRNVQFSASDSYPLQGDSVSQGVKIWHTLTLSKSQHRDKPKPERVRVVAQVERPGWSGSGSGFSGGNAVGEFGDFRL
ncbi:hypothetical protein V8G54_021364 [Vigna mungo]|uniref:Uncharacterized protein n=1 Tax=Vigna mungo TaxID=3915 RepID=A0AAQ3NH78_VIGMU